MRRCAWIAALILTLTASRLGFADQPPSCEPDRVLLPPAGRRRSADISHTAAAYCTGGILTVFHATAARTTIAASRCRALCWPAYPAFYGWGLPAAAPAQLWRPRSEIVPLDDHFVSPSPLTRSRIRQNAGASTRILANAAT